MVDDLVRIFVSYAREDDQDRLMLRNHISSLCRVSDVEIFDDKSIEPGGRWKPELLGQLEAADIVVVLRSANFVASKFCYTVEFERALARMGAGTCEIFPINVKKVYLPDEDALSWLQYFPDKPISSLGDGQKEEAWATVSKKLHDMVNHCRTRKRQTKIADGAAADVIPIDRGKNPTSPRTAATTPGSFASSLDPSSSHQDVRRDWSGLIKALRYVDFGSCYSVDDLTVATSWLRAELALSRTEKAPDRTLGLIQQLRTALSQALVASRSPTAIASACNRCNQLKQMLLDLLTASEI